MNVERLLEMIHKTPFVPFSLLLPNEKLRVAHNDFIWVHPDRRTVIVVTEEGRTRFLNVRLLVGLEAEESLA